jgi:plasmid stabilization system protein ParE
MATVRLSAQARLDLLSALEHLDEVAGPQIARRYDDSFKRSIENLSTSAGTGSPRQHLGPETRVTSVAPYLIFYDGGPHSERVHVLRILHGHRNITPDLIARGRET